MTRKSKNKFGFTPYTDGAGPTLEWSNKNTKALSRALTTKGIWHELVTEDDEFLVELSNGTRIVYDRWGFCDDGDLDLDQAGWDETVEAIEANK